MLSNLVESGFIAAQTAIESVDLNTLNSDITDIPEIQSLWGWRKKDEEEEQQQISNEKEDKPEEDLTDESE